MSSSTQSNFSLTLLSSFVIIAGFLVTNSASIFRWSSPVVHFTPTTIMAATQLPYTISQYITGLSQPTQISFSPDGRMFISEKSGVVRIAQNGILNSTPYLQIPVDSIGERGLMSLAFDPEYTTNRNIYTYYTHTNGQNRVSRFTTSASNPNQVQSGSELVLLEIPDPSTGSSNHNGGSVFFRNDGYLYVTTGDGGSDASNSQNLNNLLGKVLRLNKSDGSAAPGNMSGRIYAYGLRNPYTTTRNPINDEVFIYEVGGGSIEEINRLSPGANYGWPTCEGSCGNSSFTNPVYQYDHGQGQAIVGGAFWNGFNFFGDYVQGWIRRLSLSSFQADTVSTDTPQLVDMAVGPDNCLYAVSIGGTIYRFNDTNRSCLGTTNPTPTPTRTPTPIPGPVNTAPIPTINTPSSGSRFNANDSISFSGSATDAEDGNLSASAFNWRVVFHHDDHTHPFIDLIANTKSGAFIVPNEGETSTNIWYRIYLRVTDSGGRSAEVYRDIYPNIANLNFNSSPSGLQITVDGIAVNTPASIPSVVGFKRLVGILSPQTKLGNTYSFFGWSNSQPATHTLTTPASGLTLTANFSPSSPLPTPAPGGYLFGYPQIGTQIDANNANTPHGVKFTTPNQSLTAKTAKVYINNIDPTAGNRLFSAALYTSVSDRPGQLISTTSTVTASGNGWIEMNFPSSVSLVPNTTYWLAFNNNGSSSNYNTYSYNPSTGTVCFWTGTITFGNWPATFSGSDVCSNAFSMVLTADLSGTGGAPIPTITIVPTSTPSPSASWTFCANENQYCNFSGTKTVRYGTSQTGNYVYKTFTNGVNCDNNTFGDPAKGYQKSCHYETSTLSPTSSPIPPTNTPTSSANPCSTTGSVVREVWTGVKSDNLSSVNFATSPSFTSNITRLVAPANWADDYATRIRGYLCPTTTGSYTFWIASDNEGQFWLSTNSIPANRQLRASLSPNQWTSDQEWGKYPQQQSTPITLYANQPYYFEIYQKEGWGGDNVSVAWSGPGITRQVIPGANISKY